MLAFHDLIDRFRAKLDIFYIVISFKTHNRSNVELVFPNKFAYYKVGELLHLSVVLPNALI
jgi:hypothetical protein